MDGLVGILLPIVSIILVFWLLIIRPQQRRQREVARLQASIAVGDRVMLTSGFVGTVAGLDGEHARVELAPGTVVTVVRAAIGTQVPDAEENAGADPEAGRPSLDKTNDAGES